MTPRWSLSGRRLLGSVGTGVGLLLLGPALWACAVDFAHALMWAWSHWGSELTQFFGICFLFPLTYLGWVLGQIVWYGDWLPLLDALALWTAWRVLVIALDAASYEPPVLTPGRPALRPEAGLAGEPAGPEDTQAVRTQIDTAPERTWESMTAWAPPPSPRKGRDDPPTRSCGAPRPSETEQGTRGPRAATPPC